MPLCEKINAPLPLSSDYFAFNPLVFCCLPPGGGIQPGKINIGKIFARNFGTVFLSGVLSLGTEFFTPFFNLGTEFVPERICPEVNFPGQPPGSPLTGKTSLPTRVVVGRQARSVTRGEGVSCRCLLRGKLSLSRGSKASLVFDANLITPLHYSTNR